MKSPNRKVRRSIALPNELVAGVLAAAPPELKTNFSRLVTVALEEFWAHLREHEFARQMAEMARDPELQAEIHTIDREFLAADADGLGKKP